MNNTKVNNNNTQVNNKPTIVKRKFKENNQPPTNTNKRINNANLN